MSDPNDSDLAEARQLQSFWLHRTGGWTADQEVAELARRFARVRAQARAEAIEEAARILDEADEQYIDPERLARFVRALAR